MEVTTITVSERTRKELEELKKKKQIKSFDKLLSQLAKKELKVADSMFGAIPGIKRVAMEVLKVDEDQTDRIIRSRKIRH